MTIAATSNPAPTLRATLPMWAGGSAQPAAPMMSNRMSMPMPRSAQSAPAMQGVAGAMLAQEAKGSILWTIGLSLVGGTLGALFGGFWTSMIGGTLGAVAGDVIR